MKSDHKELLFAVPTRQAFIDIPSEVQLFFDECGITEGLSKQLKLITLEKNNCPDIFSYK